MRINKNYIVIIIFLFALFEQQDAFSQGCAMCKIAPESNFKDGGDIAKNLNTGILFLLAIPYSLILIAVGYFFRKQINEKLIKMGWKKQ